MNITKTVILSLSILISAMVVTSCKKTATATTTGTAFTHATMKPWFDSYCASCHASGKSDSGKWLYNPNDYENSIKASISSLYRTIYSQKSMPQGQTLSASELASFKTWYDAGYPTN
jgi:mono/diheme cytochrome c family protein